MAGPEGAIINASAMQIVRKFFFVFVQLKVMGKYYGKLEMEKITLLENHKIHKCSIDNKSILKLIDSSRHCSASVRIKRTLLVPGQPEIRFYEMYHFETETPRNHRIRKRKSEGSRPI